jgi:uncharacterized oxidoreductase
MSHPSGQELRITEATLRKVVNDIFRSAGSNDRECNLVADHLVEANLKGHDSHGVGMIPAYIESLKANELTLNHAPRVINDTGGALVLDGGLGLGQSIAFDAMAMGIERVKKSGSAIIALNNSHHIGRIGHWAEQCAREGLVSIHFVNVISNPVVAPFGGKVPKLVTNPIAIGIPRRDNEPVIVDFATSKLAHGKIRVAYNKGVKVPDGTLIDADGKPTNDPAAMFEEPTGAILPFGEHKGWTLAFACEALAGALTGGQAMKGPVTQKAIINNMLSIIVSPEALGTQATYLAELESFVHWAQLPSEGQSPTVLLPGDPERATKAERLQHGIPVDRNTWLQIVAAGTSVGVSEAELHAYAG